MVAAVVGRNRVLFDDYLIAELARPDLDLYLGDLYRNHSALLVPFLCSDYQRKKWCRLEWRQMRDIIFNFEGERLMPFRFDDSIVEGFLSIDGYIEVVNRSPETIANLILERIGERPVDFRSNTKSNSSNSSRIAHSRLFFGRNVGSDFLVGREKEILELDAAWDGPHRKNIVTIVGFGGMGKTSLVAHWAAHKLGTKDRFGIECYFDWSFYSQGTRRISDATTASHAVSADLFIKEALEFFGEPKLASSNLSASHKGERLGQLIAGARTLLILDGLEPLQDVRTGKLRDDGLRALLRSLAAHNPGLALITTRQHLPELNTWHNTVAPEWRLAFLTDEEGGALLTRLGVRGTESQKHELSKRVKGHALTLTLLGHFLKRAHHGDVRCAKSIDFGIENEKEQEGHAFRVIAAYEQWFQENGCHSELAILRMLGLFDRPASPDCLAALRNASISGLTDSIAVLRPAEWNEAVNQLAELNLVEEQSWEPNAISGFTEEQATHAQPYGREDKAGAILGPVLFTSNHPTLDIIYSLDAHPLVREYFANSLRKRNFPSWTAAHACLYEHLQKAAPYWPSDISGMQPLFQAVSHGCHAGQHQDVFIQIFRTRINRGRHHYLVNGLGATDAEFSLLSLFFKEEWKPVNEFSDVRSRIRLLRQIGLALRATGNLKKAIEPLSSGFRLSKSVDDWNESVNIARHIAQTYLVLGNIVEARQWASESVSLLTGRVDKFDKVAAHAGLAHILHYQNDISGAISSFKTAGGIDTEGDQSKPLFAGLQRYRYCELLLTLKDYDNAFRLSAIPFERSDGAIFVAANALASTIRARVLMATRFEEEQTTIAELLGHAVETLRNSGRRELMVFGLLPQAELYVETSRTKLAEACLNEAEGIANEGSMRLYLIDIRLFRARHFQDVAALDQASLLIEETGYWLRKQELESIKASLKK